jgi:hypothetical protein
MEDSLEPENRVDVEGVEVEGSAELAGDVEAAEDGVGEDQDHKEAPIERIALY